MAFDFSTVTSMKGKILPPITRAQKRTSAFRQGPNPWLDPKWDMSIAASYDNNETYELEFPGKYETYTITKGVEKGKTSEKITGDAYDAIVLIREASAKEDLGVSIRTRSGKNGFVFVSWCARKRKAPRKNTTQATTTETA